MTLLAALLLPVFAAGAAINGAVVPKSQWTDATLNDGDEIEIIRATQGG